MSIVTFNAEYGNFALMYSHEMYSVFQNDIYYFNKEHVNWGGGGRGTLISCLIHCAHDKPNSNPLKIC